MMLPYKKLPIQFLIELVFRVTMLMNSIPKKGGIHRIISPRELITGKKLRVPEHHIGQYVQGHTGGNNDTGKERSVDASYIDRADNGSGHVIFKLSMNQRVSVNRVTAITPIADHIKLVEDIAEAKNQPEGLEFANINGKVTLDDFIEGINDDDNDNSNASDDDFVHDEEYQKEFNEETRLEKNEGLAVDKDQADAFGNDLQQLVQDPTDRPALKKTRLRPRINRRVVALSHEIQECGSVNKKKKKKKSNINFINNDNSNQEMEGGEASFFDAVSNHPSKYEPSIDADPDTNPDPTTDLDANPGVGDNVDNDSSPNLGVHDNKPAGLDNSFNPDGYWGINAHSTCEYVLNTIASFTNFEASKSTPQYGFNRGMKEFGELGFEATMKELDDNLIGMGAVQMLKPNEVNKDVWCKALSYLMFLKRKRDGTVKARGCADG
jgi:hypothetical protein